MIYLTMDFELIQDNIGTNLLTKFHEHLTIYVAATVFTRQLFMTHNGRQKIDKRKNALPLGSHFLQANIIFFELIQDIIETNLLTKFHEDWTINVASRVLTRKNALPLMAMKKAPPPWWPYIIGMSLLTEFHEDRSINVACRVKNAPPLGGHDFKANVTIFELIQDITKTNLLTIFHQDWTINMVSRVLTRKMPRPWRPCF
ncbi:hypothetical protein DPMN_016139 [Dreissena polymorpha]|uniref:Uncharacterized protein n=1 Tax=Dreissena polymorpha TaxID=45954 RepID=A0A9D4NCL0_DREPO|nr:hypothetical protein DPMN_016139 [Dreissena polymorpha]